MADVSPYSGRLSKPQEFVVPEFKDWGAEISKEASVLDAKTEEMKLKKKASQDRAREFVGKVSVPNTSGMWDGDYDTNRKWATALASDEVIRMAMASPEGEAAWTASVAALNENMEVSDVYYKDTFGTTDDAADKGSYTGASLRAEPGYADVYLEKGLVDNRKDYDRTAYDLNQPQGQFSFNPNTMMPSITVGDVTTEVTAMNRNLLAFSPDLGQVQPKQGGAWYQDMEGLEINFGDRAKAEGQLMTRLKNPRNESSVAARNNAIRIFVNKVNAKGGTSTTFEEVESEDASVQQAYDDYVKAAMDDGWEAAEGRRKLLEDSETGPTGAPLGVSFFTMEDPDDIKAWGAGATNLLLAPAQVSGRTMGFPMGEKKGTFASVAFSREDGELAGFVMKVPHKKNLNTITQDMWDPETYKTVMIRPEDERFDEARSAFEAIAGSKSKLSGRGILSLGREKALALLNGGTQAPPATTTPPAAGGGQTTTATPAAPPQKTPAEIAAEQAAGAKQLKTKQQTAGLQTEKQVEVFQGLGIRDNVGFGKVMTYISGLGTQEERNEAVETIVAEIKRSKGKAFPVISSAGIGFNYTTPLQ